MGAFRAEWRKLSRRPANWIICALLLLLTVAASYAISYLVYRDAGARSGAYMTALYPDVFVQRVGVDLYPLGAALAMLIGILSVGSEYSWGTLRLVFLTGPGRLRTLATRLVALTLLTLGMTVAVLGLGAASSVVVAALQGHPVTWPAAGTVMSGLATGWLVLTVFALVGLTLALLFRQSAVPIAAGFAYLLLIEDLVLRVLGPLGSDTLANVARALPGRNADALIQTLENIGAANPHPPLVGAWQAAIVLLLYCAALGGIASLLVRRRDLA